ncbi:MAG: hypothetical protein K2J90_10075 [Lachnospiraceae bacterium]|nr:hypothetical protein [Lachnospiraceae bacterium]
MYGFIRQENIALPGIVQSYRYENNAMVVAQIEETIFKGLSAQMMGVELPAANILDYEEYMRAFDCHFLLFVWKEQEEDRLYFFSDTKRLRALEFLDYLIPEFGLVKGKATGAGGRISSAILKVKISGMELASSMEYFLKMSDSYHKDCVCIDAGIYGREHKEDIRKLKKYRKKRIPWAVVRTTDIVKNGEHIRIKSLENESGITLTADPEVYIMIGCRGEVYDMKRIKFEQTYDETEESVDIFKQMLDFLPEAEIADTGEYISLDEIAHLCYPKPGSGIYAKKLGKRTKIFPAGGSEEYYLGRPGDYMAVRPEDFQDIYVVQREIFRQTYEEDFS